MKTGIAGLLSVALISVFLFARCAVVPAPGGSEEVLVPALPDIVVLDQEPYYFYGGYHYYYRDDQWFYSRSRGGPWLELPRDRYPKETRFRGRHEERGWEERRGYDRR